MNEDEQTLLLIKGAIAEMPAEDQHQVAECAAQLRTSVTHHGKHGAVALALVGAEVQAGRLDGVIHG